LPLFCRRRDQAGDREPPTFVRPEIDSAIIEELLKSYERPTDLTGPGGIIEELHKRLYERVLEAELTHYLGYGKGEAPEQAEG
jgi:hypothetical protein